MDGIERRADLVEAEAAAFRALVRHLQTRTDAHNIDLMNLAGFCRNCLHKWLKAAAEEQGVTLTPAEAQERVYGMAYDEWKTRFQREASPEQMRRYKETEPLHSPISRRK